MILKPAWHSYAIRLSLVGIILILSNLTSSPAESQPSNIPQLPRPEPSIPPAPEKPPQLPPPQELLPDIAPPALPEEVPATESGTIVVTEFKFIGNTAFSAEELAALTRFFTGRPISFAELIQARSAVTQLYVDNGYITSGAYIPQWARALIE